MNEMTIDTRLILATYFRDRRGETENRPQIALASERFRAIDLSCRACGAMAMGAGLGFPVGDSAALRFHPQPPIGKAKHLLAAEPSAGPPKMHLFFAEACFRQKFCCMRANHGSMIFWSKTYFFRNLGCDSFTSTNS